MARNRHDERIRVHRPRQHVRLKGAVAGMVSAGAAALLFTHTAPESLEPLARLALVLPAVLYVLWWVFGPGFAGNSDADVESPAVASTDPELLRTTFDDASVYSAMRRPDIVSGDAERLRATLRHQPGAVPPELRPAFRRHAAGPESASAGS